MNRSNAQLRFDGKCKYCKYFDFYGKAFSKGKYKNCQWLPPGVQMTRLTKLGHAAIFGRNYCNGDFLALALTTFEF